MSSVLGNHRGVEGETTMYAGMKSMQAAQNSTSEFVETALRRMNAMRSEYEVIFLIWLLSVRLLMVDLICVQPK